MQSDKLLKERHHVEGKDISAKVSVYPYGNNQYIHFIMTENLRLCPWPY